MVDATVEPDPGTGSAGEPSWDEARAAASAGQQVALSGDDGTALVLLSAERLRILQSLSTARRGAEAETLLSKREGEVLGHAATGQSASAIADELGLAVNTVAQHLVSVRRKLAVHSTREAVAIARSAGLIP